ncbi:MAG: hypothetical protein LBK82_06585 [Planctomycetaceae bacterium]|nr:hypothetical protein [Planctomycetaceae bacterium]
MGNPSAGRLRRLSLYFAVINLIHCRRKWVGNPSAGRLRRLSLHFAIINLIHCRLTPTRPFSERSPTLLS